MNKVFCFGELLLRMSPDTQAVTNAQMPFYIGGAELNVASALSSWRIPARYCTALPDNWLSKILIGELNERNIDCSAIQITGERIGIYYLPQGSELKNAGVIYDRKNSSFASLKTGMIDWDKMLDQCSWFHFSAISPALNESAAELCLEAVKAAKAKGLKVSVDLNYRSKLWQYGKKPIDVMPALLSYCDVIMGNIWAAESLLGISSPVENSDGRSKEELIDAAGKSMKAIHIAYPQAGSIAYTFRLDKTYFAIMQHGSERVISKEFPMVGIVDKVGSGDCFMGGLIYGLYQKQKAKEIIDFAAAAAVGKMKEKGDATNQTIESVKSILEREWTAISQSSNG